jgi:tetratricopeptide (TPR) repeat protein
VNPFDKSNTSARALLLCLALAAVCYTNSLLNAFILDDALIVAANERIRHVQPLHVLFQPYWGDLNHAGIYRPLTILSFSLEYPIWRVWAPGYRLVNLLLHALNGWLVFLLARGLLGSPIAALASAAVYVIHPMQTEAVVSIVGRSELLAAGLFFTAWLAFRKGRTAWSAGAYFLAVLAKESAITFPLVAMVEMGLGDGGIQKIRESWRRFVCLAVTGIGYLCLRWYVLGGLGIPRNGQYLNGTLTLSQRWITSGRVFLQYFRLLFAPIRVTGDYDFNSIPLAGWRDWDALLGLTLVLACFVVAALLARKKQAISLGIFFFFITLLPVSNWIMPIALLMAERFLYTPAFGFALLAGIAWAAIPRDSLRRVVAAGVVTAAVILCIAHNYIWQDTYTFHQNAVKAIPNNARARLGYGFALLRLNKTKEAKAEFEAGLRIMPWSAPLLAGLAKTMVRIDGSCDRARPILVRSLTIQPGQWQSLWLLGDCLRMEGRTDQAEQAYGLAVQNADFPDAELLASWARTLEATGRTPSAIAAYERAALINPNDETIQAELKQLTRPN